MQVIEPLLLAAARVATYEQERGLTNASGFFFERDGRLFLVTSRHVVIDEPSNLADSTGFSIPLYRGGKSVWRQGLDAAGEIDVAAIELERDALPDSTGYRAFTLGHLSGPQVQVEVGSSLLVVGFPLGFHDTLHHMPVVRQAVIASSFGRRFRGEGYFLTDARTHRGTSGAPVEPPGAKPVHVMVPDHRGHETGVLWIKGSGSDMLTISPSHFTSLRVDDLLPVNRGIKKAFPR